jgi:signal transduction histidine kinase
MIAVYFVYGLSFFAMSLAVGLQARRASTLPLGKQLGWLAAFGLFHSLSDWTEMYMLIDPANPELPILRLAHLALLPISTVLLVRFGIGLVREAGPLPAWMTMMPVVLIVPLALLAAYALVMALTEPPLDLQADIWSRYLLYFPGCLLAAYGFERQWRSLQPARRSRARTLMLGAAMAFLGNALVAGLIVPPMPDGLAAWLNTDRWLAVTGLPVQVGRMSLALLITFCVVQALGVFEAERAEQIAELQARREQAQQAALQVQSEARQAAEAWITGLVSLSRRIAELEPVDAVLGAVVELARHLLRADVATLALWNADHTRLETKCYATAQRAYWPGPQAVTSPIILRVVEAGKPCRFPDDMGLQPGPWFSPALQVDLEAAAIVPLLFEGQSLGAMWIGLRAYRPLAAEDLAGLERLAAQVVIAIQHSLLAANLQSLAVTEERSRIAREMHDGLAQILGYLSLELQTLTALVRQGDSKAALEALKAARQRIRAAQADVRENIVSLRTTLAGDVGLVPALQQYVDEFSIATGVEARLVSQVGDGPCLSPLAEVQLVRVIQESLTNVRKHARAHSVEVKLMARDQRLEVEVADDGVGFVPAGNGRGHFGLYTMRERVESVGGRLAVFSQPGAGTRVEINMPLQGA